MYVKPHCGRTVIEVKIKGLSTKVFRENIMSVDIQEKIKTKTDGGGRKARI